MNKRNDYNPGAALAACEESGALRPEGGGRQKRGGRQRAGVCPACGARDDYRPALRLRSPFSLLVFLAGRLLAVLFYNASRAKRVQCNRCGALFSVRTPWAKLSLGLFWLLLAPAFLATIFLLFYLVRSLFSP